jgi:hypothetical protein
MRSMKGIENTCLVCLLILGGALFGTLLVGQDSFAQTGLCDPDPCQSIANAVAGTCTEIGGSCTAASDYMCSCNGQNTWQDATNTCKCDGVVDFPDPILEQEIRIAIGQLYGDIYADDLLGLTYLTPPAGISDLSGLECCTALTQLSLWSHHILDVSPLAGLTNLTYLTLFVNQILDVSPLAGLTNLTQLALHGNQILDLSPLSGLTNLTSLTLIRNQILDVSPLAGLTKLTGLSLGENEIVDVSPLAGLTHLARLGLSDNQIVDVSPLAGLTYLTWLYLGTNQIVDVSPLAGLIDLTELDLVYNEIVDMCPLVDNAGLDYGDILGLFGNPMRRSCTVCIPQLEGRGVQVWHDCL